MQRSLAGLAVLSIPFVLVAASVPPLPKDTMPAALNLSATPRGFAARPAAPSDNPVTAEKVHLGRRLFFDPLLSGDRTVACASCHVPDRGFATADATAIGIRGQSGPRNAPSLLNVGYGTSFFWDGRAKTLEEQALLPIQDPLEMGSSVDETIRRLKADPTYPAQFRDVFGGEEPVSPANLARAIAAFERTLVSGNNAVDRFRHGEVTSLSESGKQGLWLFESRGGCWKCHTGNNLTDERFHNTGVQWTSDAADTGRAAVTKEPRDHRAYKTPTLRNVARTAPYMHDGSLKTLEDVVQFYRKGGTPNPHLDPLMKPLDLSDKDVKDLVAFLEALTGEFPPKPE